MKQEFLRQFSRMIQSAQTRNLLLVTMVLAAVTLMVSSYQHFISPPAQFPKATIVEISEGQTLTDVSEALERANIINSPFMYRVITTALGGERSLVAGAYYFEKPIPVTKVADRITHGKTKRTPTRITIPEGATLYRMAQLFDYNLVNFDPVRFIRYAHGSEGYLFPDTYEVLAHTDEQEIVQRMRSTFRERIKPLRDEIEESPRTLDEIVTMASILEKEVATDQDRRMVAGVLWNRIDIDMALQVDAAFSHVNGKNTYELTLEDLRTDAPFNTYTNKGLPPRPISNPGLSSIKAALRPAEHSHIFYLSDRRGNTYYSETFAEHKQKKAIYMN